MQTGLSVLLVMTRPGSDALEGHAGDRECFHSAFRVLLGQGRADPGPGDGLIKGQLPIEGGGITGYAPANFIGVENGSGRRQIA